MVRNRTRLPGVNDTLDDYLAQIGPGPIAGLRARTIDRLIRMRVLDETRVQGRLVACVDGTGYLTFRWQHCEHCLTRQCGEHTLYSHQALEAKLLGPAETVLSLGSEFIDNRPWRAGGRHHALPSHEFISFQSAFRDGRDIGRNRHPPGRRDAEHPHLALLDLL